MTDPNKTEQQDRKKRHKNGKVSRNEKKFTDEERKQKEALKYHTRGGFN